MYQDTAATLALLEATENTAAQTDRTHNFNEFSNTRAVDNQQESENRAVESAYGLFVPR